MAKAKLSQADRLLAFLCANPGASAMEIITALRMPKYTGRISDLRAEGHIIEAVRVAGVWRYSVKEAPEQLVAFG